MKYLKYLFLLILSNSVYAQQHEGTPEIIRGSEDYRLLLRPVDAQTGEPLDGIAFFLFENGNNELVETQISLNGTVGFDIHPMVEYEVRTCHPDYAENGLSIFECNEGDEVFCTYGGSEYTYLAYGGKDKPGAIFGATLNLQKLTVGSVFELDNVYYDLDKSDLKPEAKKELSELADIMHANESITIELSSHTDARASEAYNLQLSEERAMSCYNYLVELGIPSHRIHPVGYGESILTNSCDDNTHCVEELHQQNRRTEILVLNFERKACEIPEDPYFKDKDLLVDNDVE